MFRNYLAAALRNLARNRLYTAINILGLTVGFAAALMVALFVRDELTYDRWIPGYREVYRVALTMSPPGAPAIHSDFISRDTLDWMKLEFPEIKTAARLRSEERGIRHNGIESTEIVSWVDPQFFEVMPLPVVSGDLSAALRDPDAVVLTRAMARKYFGRDDVIGETIEIDRQVTLRVTAVLEDLPSRTHLDLEIIAAGHSAASPLMADDPRRPFMTYLRIAPGSAAAIEQRLPDAIDRHMTMPGGTQFSRSGPGGGGRQLFTRQPENVAGGGGGKVRIGRLRDIFAISLQPLTTIHLVPRGFANSMARPSGDPAMLEGLAVTGVLILFVAAANFINLMTARAGRRAVEVGVRKSVGARRTDLMAQYLGESLLYVAAALVAAILLVEILLPAFNGFLRRTIVFDPWRDPLLFAGCLGLPALIGVLAGLYPAFVLSAFRPATVLRVGQVGPSGSGALRILLVMAQFVILTGLVIGTLVINHQATFATGEGFHLDTEQVLFVASPCSEAFKNQVSSISGVRGVSCAGGSFLGKAGGQLGVAVLDDGSRMTWETAFVDSGLLELFGMKPLAGRFFQSQDTKTGADPDAAGPGKFVVLNETAVRMFHFESPAAAIGQKLPIPDQGGEVIGVVADFPLRSVRETIPAMVFAVPPQFNYLVAKLDGATIGSSLRAIDAAWQSTGPSRPIQRQFFDQHLQELYIDLLRETQAFSIFAMVAIFIACLGLFGLAAFTVERRTKEIGIRKVMGAGHGEIFRLLLWEFEKPVLWANAIAWPASYYVMHRWLQGFAYHVDLAPWIFIAATALALVIAFVTVCAHALLVARAEPATALRYE